MYRVVSHWFTHQRIPKNLLFIIRDDAVRQHGYSDHFVDVCNVYMYVCMLAW